MNVPFRHDLVMEPSDMMERTRVNDPKFARDPIKKDHRYVSTALGYRTSESVDPVYIIKFILHSLTSVLVDPLLLRW